jgi:hypothetical protein
MADDLSLGLTAGRSKGGSVCAAGAMAKGGQILLREFSFLLSDGTNPSSSAYLPLRKVCL